MTRRAQRLLPVAKLTLEQLGLLLTDLLARDPRLLFGPQIGQDAAVAGGREP